MSHAPIDLWEAYLKRGYAPVPLHRQSKKPSGGEGWQNFRAGPGDRDLFRDQNLGLLLGEPSGGLCDVDCDTPEAIAVAAILLPTTHLVSGRASAPRAHYWYMCQDPPPKASTSFDDLGGTRLVELRSSGGQTMVPPSIHPTGEAVVWQEFGEP
jgi:hypothetical protein